MIGNQVNVDAAIRKLLTLLLPIVDLCCKISRVITHVKTVNRRLAQMQEYVYSCCIRCQLATYFLRRIPALIVCRHFLDLRQTNSFIKIFGALG
jgi:hypothetical protein